MNCKSTLAAVEVPHSESYSKCADGDAVAFAALDRPDVTPMLGVMPDGQECLYMVDRSSGASLGEGMAILGDVIAIVMRPTRRAVLSVADGKVRMTYAPTF